MPGSRQGLAPGQQLYAAIEFCRNQESLFGKINSGRYDWLGVTPDGRYVVGSPPRRRAGVQGSLSGIRPGVGPGNRVEVVVPLGSGPTTSECESAEAAQAEFQDTITRLTTPDGGSGIYRVRLFQDGVLAREEYVVRKQANVL